MENTNQGRTRALWIALALLVTIAMAMAGPAHAFAQDRHFSGSLASYEVNADTLLVSYSEAPSGIANPDTTPRVRVYGSGRVLVHNPPYMKHGGDWELFLSAAELQQLLDTLQPVFNFDTEQVKKECELFAALRQGEQPAGGMLMGSVSSEEVFSQVDISVDAVTAPGATTRAVNKNLLWKNISADAKAFPEVNQLQNLATVQRSLRDFTQRDDLQRVEEGHSQ